MADLFHNSKNVHFPLSVLCVAKPGDDLFWDCSRDVMVVSKSGEKTLYRSGVMFHGLWNKKVEEEFQQTGEVRWCNRPQFIYQDSVEVSMRNAIETSPYSGELKSVSLSTLFPVPYRLLVFDLMHPGTWNASTWDQRCTRNYSWSDAPYSRALRYLRPLALRHIVYL